MDQDKINNLLRKFKKKSKKILSKDKYTEFFIINTQRQVIEFVCDEEEKLLISSFFEEFLPNEFKDFCKLSIVNEMNEEISKWYYDEEDLSIKMSINWGTNKQEISSIIDIENFFITLSANEEVYARSIDIDLLNNYIVNLVTTQAMHISKIYKKVFGKNLKK